jgi:hypothetical protein
MSRDIAPIISILNPYLRGSRAKAVVYLTMLVKRFCHECDIESTGSQMIKLLHIEPVKLKEVTDALKALIKALSSTDLDIDTAIEELERRYYYEFVEALYFFIKDSTNKYILKKIFETLFYRKLRTKEKTRKGSFVVKCSAESLDTCVAKDLELNMSYNELRQLGIVLPYYSYIYFFSIKEYYVVVPAPYADEDYFPRHFRI